jgi:phage gp29-like protein
MAVIYLDRRRKLTEKQKKMAEVIMANEINDVMADLEILEEELDKTFLFSELDLRKQALEYLGRKVKQNPDGSYDEKLLKRVYEHYFGEQKGE